MRSSRGGKGRGGDNGVDRKGLIEDFSRKKKKKVSKVT